MDEIYFLLDRNTGEHEFTFTVNKYNDKTKYEFKRGKSIIWANPDEVLITAIDTGNGFIIEPLCIDNTSQDYSDIECLYLLLDCIHMVDINLAPKYDFIKTENKTKPDFYIKCPDCLGEGNVLIQEDSVNSLGEYEKDSSEIELCKKCNGVGFVLYEVKE